jgi:hypothetical protein
MTNMSEGWYYTADRRNWDGPHSASQLLELLDAHLIDRQTLVWRQGAQNWEPLEHALGVTRERPPPISGEAPCRASANTGALRWQSKNATVKPQPVNRKAQRLNWLLWWRIDQNELAEQVAQYDHLPLHRSARGIAIFCLGFTCVVSAAFATFGTFGLDESAYWGIALYGALALFIWRGHRWAMIVAMLFWTADKALLLAGMPKYALGQIVWWALYMHAFYFAFRVEEGRASSRDVKATTATR